MRRFGTSARSIVGQAAREVARAFRDAFNEPSPTISTRRVPDEWWWNVLHHFDYRCVYCGREGIPLTRDHIDALACGGAHEPQNIVPACRSCNSSKGVRTVEFFAPSKAGMIREAAASNRPFDAFR